MHLLKTAVRAKIPLIGVKTDDPNNFSLVAEEIIGKPVSIVASMANLSKKFALSVHSIVEGSIGCTAVTDAPWADVEQWMVDHDRTLIILNADPHPSILDLGTIEVPASMIHDFVAEHGTKDNMAQVCSALSGLSLTDMKRISAMATARYGEFTAKSIRAMRREFFQAVRGLEELATEQLFYDPTERITEWLSLEGKLFKPNTHPLLTPRGFLFTGPPGTGKTSGAKYLAQQLKVPLYRLDMGMVLSKWAGESDARLMAALKQADSFEPCVLLLDEVEKLFEVNDQSGIVTRLLGSLLWWLQEHSSTVLVIMTTNAQDKLPPELFRAGRIDEEVKFSGLLQTQLLPFIQNLATKLKHIAVVPTEDLEALSTQFTSGVSHARVTEQVLRVIKLHLISQQEKHSEQQTKKSHKD